MTARVSADALIRTFEEETARALGRSGRRSAGVYYTPLDLAAQVVELARTQGGAALSGSVVDPCAGAGAFLLAARRAGFSRLCGFDLDAAALRVARQVVPGAQLRKADSLRVKAGGFDVLVSNPPYGHLSSEAERAWVLRALPGLRGGEVDRYAAFLLRSLQLVRPGGVVALLIPDTWMSNARAGALRQAVLAQAELAALVDLGKPFAAAKDTRVQAAVLVRRPSLLRACFVGRGREALAPAPREELLQTAARGWQVYRSAAERRLCAAMEAASVPLGQACTVGYGMRTGDNGRHVARRVARAGEIALCGGEDITPFALRLRPKTLLHGGELEALVLKQLGLPLVAVQRIRTNSSAPWARWLEAAPVAGLLAPSLGQVADAQPWATAGGSPGLAPGPVAARPRHAGAPAEAASAGGEGRSPVLVCLDSLSTLSCEPERLWALLALIQSVALQHWHRLRTTDVNVKPSALRELPVPHRLLGDPRELAALSRARAAQAREIAALSDPRAMLIPGGAAEPLGRDRAREAQARAHALDRRIDAVVYRLFGLPEALVDAAERGFWLDRFPEENQALHHAMSDPPASVARKEETA